MTDLPDFLLARIAEAEMRARLDLIPPPGGWVNDGLSLDYLSYVNRALDDCDAKRRIVEYWGRADDDWAAGSPMVGYRAAMGDVLRALALLHADHPDYDEGWRP